jgi:hypothetical protein
VKVILTGVLVALVVWMLLRGGSSSLVPCTDSKAAYVRDPAHHCVEGSSDIIKRDHKYLQDDGTLTTIYGWRGWDCDNGVTVTIDNDEVQP